MAQQCQTVAASAKHECIAGWALRRVVQYSSEADLLQAVGLGLLPLLLAYMGMPLGQEPAQKACANMLNSPVALAEMRRTDSVQDMILAAHSGVELGRWVSTDPEASGIARVLLEADLLAKLEVAQRQMVEPAEQQDVAEVIAALARLNTSGPGF